MYSAASYALFIDCDDFKSINEKYGHAGGDAVLHAVAQRAQSAVRGSDLVARVGGDEFMVVMPSTTMEDACNVAERVRRRICEEELELESGKASFTVSLGLSKVSEGNFDLEVLLALTCEALKSSKSCGKNRVTVLS